MAKTLYEDMMNLNKPSSVMRPGEYFISQQGRNAQSNIAGLTGQTINVPNIQQMQGGTPAVLPASTSYQSQVDYQPLPANVERPIIEQGGSYNMPNVARPQDDLSINPEGLPLSDIDVLNRRNALAGGGSVANRNAIKAQIERERAVGTARESAKAEENAFNKQLALKGYVGAGAELKKEIATMGAESKKTVAQLNIDAKDKLVQFQEAQKNGRADEANALKKEIAQGNIEARRKEVEDTGKIVGSPEWVQQSQQLLARDEAKLRASGVIKSEQDAVKFRNESELELVKELVGKFVPLDEAVKMVRSQQTKDAGTPASAVAPKAQGIRLPPEQIDAAKQLATQYTKETVPPQLKDRWEIAVEIKRLTEKQAKSKAATTAEKLLGISGE